MPWAIIHTMFNNVELAGITRGSAGFTVIALAAVGVLGMAGFAAWGKKRFSALAMFCGICNAAIGAIHILYYEQRGNALQRWAAEHERYLSASAGPGLYIVTLAGLVLAIAAAKSTFKRQRNATGCTSEPDSNHLEMGQ